ncbi:MAG: glycosyltransferase family 4 protein [Desulfovibrionaceae bacterium]
MARIALILPRYSRYGGVEGVGYRLSEALARDGHEVDFICARAENEPAPGVRPVTVGRHGLTRAGKMLWFALAAEKARKAGGYDLSIGLGKTLGQDILRVSGGPLATFWALSERAWPQGWRRSLKRLARRLSPVSWVIARIEAKHLREAPRIIVVSHLTLDWLKAAYPWLDASKVSIIYNRPDLSRFAPCDEAARQAARAAFGIAPQEVAVTFAGTAFPRKGMATLIPAMAKLPPHFRLLVAGERNPGHYLRMARELGVADRVTFLGRVDAMAQFYHASDVFALPSLYDTCSNAVLEALASGVKVVGSADDGSSYFLPERWRVADPASPAELAAVIAAAAAEPAPEPFAWPEDVASGLEPYLAYVRAVLREKGMA